MSNIRYKQDTGIITPRSWLIENLRYMFPNKFGLPLKNGILSRFLFGTTPPQGKRAPLTNFLRPREKSSRIDPSVLLAIDYRVSKLTVEDFDAESIKLSVEGLETLQKSVSSLVYFYIFGGYHKASYISETTVGGWEVGAKYWTLEYEIIRALFFAAAEANNGNPLPIKTLATAAGLSGLGDYLAQGYSFGPDTLDKLFSYCKKLTKSKPQGSNSQIFRFAKEQLDGYYSAYRVRHKAFVKSRKFPSVFQKDVHHFVEVFFNSKFTSEVSLRALTKENFVTVTNDQDIREKIFVHHNFRLDGYQELSNSIKKYLGLDDKWIGIAFEGQCIYTHDDPMQRERDRKKRLVCEEKNILLFEVWYEWDKSTWGNEILKQIKSKTGVEISLSKLSGLAKFLGGNN